MSKNELMNKELENSKKYKKLGLILICVGLGLTMIGVLSTIFNFFGIKNSLSPFNSVKFINGVASIIFSGFTTALIIAGIIIMIVNDNKIKKNIKEDVIPKAKETLNKAEPVVTDVIKTVGEGIEDITHNVKETIDKNKNNKKGE